jgi:predicted esterase
MDRKHDRSSYPEPFFVDARREHQQSLILLHGRGSNGKDFGEGLLRSQIGLLPEGDFEPTTIAAVLPNTKFIFPTARKRRAKWYNRATISQWFDNVPIDEQDAGMSQEQAEWQLEGLRQSREYLRKIVDEEITLVGAANVFVGGLSQGCAMGLHFLLSYTGFRSTLGGFIGMSGWLPFVDDMEDILHPPRNDEEHDDNDECDDPFALSDSDFDHVEHASSSEQAVLPSGNIALSSAAVTICNFVRDNMDLEPMTGSQHPPWVQTPVFLGHGTKDEKVKVGKGFRAAEFLRKVGMQVTWKEYDEGHGYKIPEELDDIVQFLQERIAVGKVG